MNLVHRDTYGYIQHRFNDAGNAELGGADGQGGMSQPSALIPSANYLFHPLDFLTDYVIYIPGQRLNGWLRADEVEQGGLSTYTPIFCHAPLCMAIPLDGPKMNQRVRVWNRGIYY